MSGTTLTIKGWKAVLVLLVLAGVGLFRITTASARLDAQARAKLEAWVQAELIRPILADSARSLEEKGAAITQASSVNIRSLAVRGKLSNAVVRVELAPNAALPPGTDLVRYYRMQYSSLIGWKHRGNATQLAWYLAAF